MTDDASFKIGEHSTIFGPVVHYNYGAILYVHQQYGPIVATEVDAAKLKQAQDVFAALPTTTVPVPTAPPADSTFIPYRRNSRFVGRVAEMQQIAAILKQGDAAIITGGGGFGKTQLACEFAYRYWQFFPGGVFWCSFADPDAIPGNIAAQAYLLPMLQYAHPVLHQLDQHVVLRLVLAAWNSALPRLLIFDNCERKALLDRFRPQFGGSRVLVTSRRTDWSGSLDAQTVSLPLLKREESIALLEDYDPGLSNDRRSLDDIARLLDDLPLALHLAGTYLAQKVGRVSAARYVERIGTAWPLSDTALKPSGLSPTDYHRSLKESFALSCELLDPADPHDAHAMQLLARAAHFAPGEPLPVELLLHSLSSLRNATSSAPIEPPADDAVDRLVDVGLLQRINTTSVRIHRLIADFVRSSVGDAQALHDVEQVMIATLASQNVAGAILNIKAIDQHVREAALKAFDRNDLPASDLCSTFGQYLHTTGELDLSQRYLERALFIRRRLYWYAPFHPKIASALFLLGMLAQTRSRFVQARSLHQRAYWMRCLVRGKHHQNTVASRSEFGYLLGLLAEYRRAQQLLEQVLEHQRPRLGSEHPHVARTQMRLAYVMYQQGDFATAQWHLEMALAIREQDKENTVGLAQTLNNLGEVLYAQGNDRLALEHHRRALALRTDTFGERHHDVAESRWNIGRALYALGSVDEATREIKAAFAINAVFFGVEHRETALIMNSRGILAAHQGDLAAARKDFLHVRELWIAFFGEHHPLVGVELNNLACLSQLAHDHEEAALVCRQAAAILEATRPEHPNTKRCRHNLDILLSQQSAALTFLEC